MAEKFIQKLGKEDVECILDKLNWCLGSLGLIRVDLSVAEKGGSVGFVSTMMTKLADIYHNIQDMGDERRLLGTKVKDLTKQIDETALCKLQATVDTSYGRPDTQIVLSKIVDNGYTWYVAKVVLVEHERAIDWDKSMFRPVTSKKETNRIILKEARGQSLHEALVNLFPESFKEKKNDQKEVA